MLGSYFTIAFRNLRRNGRYLVINVLGLGVALGFCILAYLNHRFANSYDHWHRDVNRIVRVEVVKASNKELYGICPSALGPAAAADLPGIEAQCRYDSRSTVVKHGDAVFNEGLAFADDNFFQFFDFEVAAGTLDLHDRSQVVIDEETARKYFGSGNPIGQTLIFYADTDQRLPLTVGGVVKNIPLNSSIRFHFLTHLDNQFDGPKRVDYVGWKWVVDAVFFKLKDVSAAPALARGLQRYVEASNTIRPDWKVSEFRLEPMRDLALTSRYLHSNGLWPGLPPAAVWGNVTMALMLLITAALNFANMTIAICNRRLREMGVRKVMGGTRFQLMRQLLGESLLVVVLAAGLGMILAYPICDWFNSTWKFTDVQVDYSDMHLMASIGGMVLLTTLLAGSYPAFYISSFRPSSIFRGGVLFGGSNLFSKIMMGLQVAISLVGVVTGLSFARNAAFNQRSDIGFNYQPILQAWLPAPSDYSRFNNAVKDIPGVIATTGSQHLPGFGYDMIDFKWQGEPQEAILYRIGEALPAVMEMRLAQGNWPAPAGDTIASAEIVVNQTFARQIAGNANIIGQEITFKNRTVRIVGVVSDFMTNNPFMPILPAVMNPVPMREWRRCLIKTASVAQQPQIMASIKSQWKQLFPFTPFNVGYQNEMLVEAIEVSNNIAISMAVLAGIAILLSITGLFSLVSLNVLRRMREVAVRRVMGASAGQVAWVLNKSYIWIFAFAVVLGCVGGRYLALSLMDSIFKINIGVQAAALVWSTLGILIVACTTIGIKLWQTLRVNPADVLRGD
jgi:putative ABC transport system permease protein